jgi:hypothetical protein
MVARVRGLQVEGAPATDMLQYPLALQCYCSCQIFVAAGAARVRGGPSGGLAHG